MAKNSVADGSYAPLEDGAEREAIPQMDLLKRIAIVALPLYPMQLVTRLVSLLSSSLVGNLGDATQLAAIGLSALVTNITGLSWLFGLSASLSTTSSQAWGARQYEAVGISAQRAFVVLLVFADLPLILIWFNARRWLVALGQPVDVAEYVGLYCRIRMFGVVFQTINTVLSRTLSSISRTRPLVTINIFCAVQNVCLSCFLIPRLGFIGAPIAAVCGDVVQALGTLALAWREPDFRKCWPGWRKECLQGWWSFLRLSIPTFVMLAAEWWSFDVQSFLAGLISTQAQATQAVTPQIADLQYAAGQALQTAATTLVGNLLGEGRPADAQRAARLAIFIVFIAMLIQAFFFMSIRTKLPYLFTKDQQVIQNIIKLLPITLFFSFLDGHQSMMCGVLIGAGRQTIGAPVVVFCYWVVGIPFGAFLAFHGFGHPMGINGLWLGMVTGVAIHAATFGFVVSRLKWKEAAKDAMNAGADEKLPLMSPGRFHSQADYITPVPRNSPAP